MQFAFLTVTKLAKQVKGIRPRSLPQVASSHFRALLSSKKLPGVLFYSLAPRSMEEERDSRVRWSFIATTARELPSVGKSRTRKRQNHEHHHHGLADGLHEGVGLATTRTVVVSSMIILVLDAFWAVVLL